MHKRDILSFLHSESHRMFFKWSFWCLYNSSHSRPCLEAPSYRAFQWFNKYREKEKNTEIKQKRSLSRNVVILKMMAMVMVEKNDQNSPIRYRNNEDHAYINHISPSFTASCQPKIFNLPTRNKKFTNSEIWKLEFENPLHPEIQLWQDLSTSPSWTSGMCLALCSPPSSLITGAQASPCSTSGVCLALCSPPSSLITGAPASPCSACLYQVMMMVFTKIMLKT